MQLSALSWSSSAAEGSGGQQVSPGGDDPIYLSEPGQEDQTSQDTFVSSPQDIWKRSARSICIKEHKQLIDSCLSSSDLETDWTIRVVVSTAAQSVLFLLRDGRLVASVLHLLRTQLSC